MWNFFPQHFLFKIIFPQQFLFKIIFPQLHSILNPFSLFILIQVKYFLKFIQSGSFFPQWYSFKYIFLQIYSIWNHFLLYILIQDKYFLKVIQKFLIWKHFPLTILLQIHCLIQIMQTVWPSLNWGCTWIINLVFGSSASWEPYKALCHKFRTLWLKYI